MKELIQEVTFTKYAKVEVKVVNHDTDTGKYFYDMKVTASKREMALRPGEWEQGTFITEHHTLTPSEVYYHINKLFAYSEYIATGLLNRIDLVGLNAAYRKMDYMHQQANEMNTMADLERQAYDDFCKNGVQTKEQLYIVDLDNPEGDVYPSDLEDGKQFLANIWQEIEDQEILDEVLSCMTIKELNDYMNGCDYELMTQAEREKYIKELNCKGYDETCKCITCQIHRRDVEKRYEGLAYGNGSSFHESYVSQPKAYEMVAELKQSGFQEENTELTWQGMVHNELIDRENGIRYEFIKNQAAAGKGKAYTVKVFSKK